MAARSLLFKLALTTPTGDDQAVTAFVADPASLRHLLEARDFDGVERTLTAIDHKAMRYESEDVLWAAIMSLSQPRPENEPLFDEWLAQSKGSAHARLARANFLLLRGWRVRGSNPASVTSRAQFHGMAEYHAEARRSFAALAEEHPDAILAFDGLISTCLGEGGADCSLPWLQRALAQRPGSYDIRAAYLYTLKPRWGGSYEAMEAFAAEAQKAVSTNPRLEHLLGFADADRASEAMHAENWAAAISLYTSALKHGPDPTFLADRAFAYLRAGDALHAAADIQAARHLSPAGWFYSDMRLAQTFAMEGEIAYGAGNKVVAQQLMTRANDIEVDNRFLLDWAASLR